MFDSKILCVSLVLLFSSVGFSKTNSSAGPGPTSGGAVAAGTIARSAGAFDPSFSDYKIDAALMTQADLLAAIEEFGEYDGSGYHNTVFSGLYGGSPISLIFAKNGDGKAYYYWKWPSRSDLSVTDQVGSPCAQESGSTLMTTQFARRNINPTRLGADKIIGFRSFDLGAGDGELFSNCNGSAPGANHFASKIKGYKIFNSAGLVIGFQFSISATGDYTLFHNRPVDN